MIDWNKYRQNSSNQPTRNINWDKYRRNLPQVQSQEEILQNTRNMYNGDPYAVYDTRYQLKPQEEIINEEPVIENNQNTENSSIIESITPNLLDNTNYNTYGSTQQIFNTDIKGESLKTAPDENIFQKAVNTVKTFISPRTQEEKVAKDWATIAIAKNINIPGYDDNKKIDYVNSNFSDLTKELGIRSLPTTKEVVENIITIGLASQIPAIGVIKTISGVAGYEALHKGLGYAMAKITGQKYDFNNPTTLGTLVENTPEGIKNGLDLLQFIGEAYALHGIYKGVKDIFLKAKSTKISYRILGLNNNATPEQIKAAYRAKMAEVHPDKMRGRLGRELTKEEEMSSNALSSTYNKAYENLTKGKMNPVLMPERNVLKQETGMPINKIKPATERGIISSSLEPKMIEQPKITNINWDKIRKENNITPITKENVSTTQITGKEIQGNLPNIKEKEIKNLIEQTKLNNYISNDSNLKLPKEYKYLYYHITNKEKALNILHNGFKGNKVWGWDTRQTKSNDLGNIVVEYGSKIPTEWQGDIENLSKYMKKWNMTKEEALQDLLDSKYTGEYWSIENKDNNLIPLRIYDLEGNIIAENKKYIISEKKSYKDFKEENLRSIIDNKIKQKIKEINNPRVLYGWEAYEPRIHGKVNNNLASYEKGKIVFNTDRILSQLREGYKGTRGQKIDKFIDSRVRIGETFNQYANRMIDSTINHEIKHKDITVEDEILADREKGFVVSDFLSEKITAEQAEIKIDQIEKKYHDRSIARKKTKEVPENIIERLSEKGRQNLKISSEIERKITKIEENKKASVNEKLDMLDDIFKKAPTEIRVKISSSIKKLEEIRLKQKKRAETFEELRREFGSGKSYKEISRKKIEVPEDVLKKQLEDISSKIIDKEKLSKNLSIQKTLEDKVAIARGQLTIQEARLMKEGLEKEFNRSIDNINEAISKGEFNISMNEGYKLLARFFSAKDIAYFPKEFIGYDKNGKFIIGQFFDPMIEVVEKNGMVSSKTIYHEAFHKYFNQYIDSVDKNNLLNEIKQTKNLNDKEAEEWLADEFMKYGENQETRTLGDRIAKFFRDLYNKIKEWIGKRDKFKDLFDDIIAGKAQKMFMSKFNLSQELISSEGWQTAAKHTFSKLLNNRVLLNYGKEGEEIFNKVIKAEKWAIKKRSFFLSEIKKPLKKLSDDDIVNFKNYVEGKKEIPDSAQYAVGLWKYISNEIAKDAIEFGVTIKTPSGKKVPFKARSDYYPYFVKEEELNKILSKQDSYYNFLHKVAKQNSITVARAHELIQRTLTNKSDIYGHLERSKLLNLPDEYYEIDPRKILSKYISQAYDRLGDIKEFGGDDQILQSLIEKIRRNGDDFEEVQDLINRMLGREKFNKNLVKTFQGIKTFINTTHLSLAALTNMGDLTKVFARTNFWATIKGIVQPFTHKGAKFSELAGVSTEEIEKYARTHGFENFGEKFYKYTGFESTEKYLRSVMANASKNYITILYNKLKKNPDNAFIHRRLEQFGLDYKELLERGIKEEDFIDGAIQAIMDSQPISRTDLPYYWQSPTGKLLSQYKTFAYKQARFAQDFIFKEFIKGNIKPLLLFLVTGIALGESIQNIRSIITGRKREDQTLMLRMVDDLLQIGGIGLVSDFFEAITGPSFMKGFLGFISGPTFSDIDDWLTAIVSDIKVIVSDKKKFAKITKLSRKNQSQMKTLKKILRSTPFIGAILTSYLFPTQYSRGGTNVKNLTDEIYDFFTGQDSLFK